MKKFLSLVLALVMTMSLVTISAGAKDFTDAEKVNYDEAVAVISAVKVVDGYEDGSFNPQGTLTRGAAAKIICNLILGPTTAAELHADTAPFSDVPTNHTFAGYIAYCAKEGIISGYADGTFRPAGTLTTYAFMKMLLGALGYDAQVEQYVGANWSINVAKQAIGIGLNDGLKGEFNGIKAVTREEACLYAFNTLKADMVEYDSKTQITVGGADVVIAGSTAKKVANKATTETLYSDDVMQFAEEYFPKLSVEVVDGTYGRPSNKWLNAKKEIGTYASIDVSFIYTEGTKEKDIYKDLGSTIVDYKDWEYFVDGKSVDGDKPGKNVTGEYAFTGDGAVTEIYVDDDAEKVTVVEYNYYLGEVTKVKSDDDGEYINVAPMSDTKLNDKKFYTEDFEEEDLVVFTRDTDEDGDYVIAEVVAPETVTGEVTRVEKDTTNNDTYLRVDGEKIPYSAHNYYDVTVATLTKAHPTLAKDYILYLDPNGFVVGFEPAEASVDKYLYVLDTHEGLRNEATVLLADGTEVDIKIDEVNGGSVTPTTLYTIKDRICTYDVDSKGVYDLDVVATRAGTGDGSVVETWGTKASAIDNGRAYFTAATGTTVIVDKKTTFVDYDGETVYTGYADVPSFDEATLAYVVEDKVAVVVFVLEGEKYDSDSTYFVLKNTDHESLKYDGSNYREYLNAYVNGEKTSLNIRYDALDGHTGDVAGANTALTYGVVYKVLKTVDEDYILDVEQAADKTSAKTVETVGADAFWLTPAGGETYKENQWDVNSDTVFMVVDYKDDGKVDSIYEGKLKNMDDDDYSITVSVLKKDEQTAELVVIFRDPVAAAAPAGSTRVETSAELAAAIADPTVDTIYMADGNYLLTGTDNVIDRDLTIIGSENAVVYANTASSADGFYVKGDADVTIENITFKGRVSYNNHGILTETGYTGNLVIKNCVFDDLYSGIWVNDGVVTVKDCDFTYSGTCNAINVENCNTEFALTISGCTFDGPDGQKDVYCDTVANAMKVTGSGFTIGW